MKRFLACAGVLLAFSLTGCVYHPAACNPCAGPCGGPCGGGGYFAPAPCAVAAYNTVACCPLNPLNWWWWGCGCQSGCGPCGAAAACGPACCDAGGCDTGCQPGCAAPYGPIHGGQCCPPGGTFQRTAPNNAPPMENKAPMNGGGKQTSVFLPPTAPQPVMFDDAGQWVPAH